MVQNHLLLKMVRELLRVISGVMGKKMITFDSVEELSDTKRGEGAFGSTGVK